MRASLRLCALASAVLSAACGDDPAASGDDAPVDAVGTDAVADADAVSADAAEDTGAGDVPADAGGDIGDDAAEVGVDASEPPCLPDSCLIGGLCYPRGAANPANGCESCNPVGAASAWTPNDAATCDDGDACTTGDRCEDGACVAAPVDCSGGGCNAGICDPETGACSSAPIDGPCTDGDPCTRGDTCVSGACVPQGASIDCDDGNACTADTCDLAGGCVHVPVDTTCDDGDPCTVGDVCGGGVCVPGVGALTCDDGDLCTLDRCVPGAGCGHVSVADRCVDENPCTDEFCDPAQGCVFPFNTIACDDGSVCSAGDTCTEGACRGAPISVDDSNPCTDDQCVEGVGATSVPNADPCDDEDACTVGDACADGFCVAGTEPLNCDDANDCTDERCDAALGCVRTDNFDDCDDVDACTVRDVCGGGTCKGEPRDCDDRNACTADTCDSVTGCASALILSNACRPTILVDYPPRAATIVDTGGPLSVRGRVFSGAGPITSFTLNGAEVPVVDGAFNTTIAPTTGGNVLLFEAVDSFGSTRKRVQSFLWARGFKIPSVSDLNVDSVNPGLGYWIGQPTLNVLAGVFNIVIQNYNLSALLPNPILEESGHTVRPRGSNPVTFGTPSTTLDARPGALHLRVVIPNLRAAMSISGWACSGNVDYTASSLTVDADIVMTVNGSHQLISTMQNVNATIANGDISFSCFLGFLIDLIIGDVSSDFETQIEGAIDDAFGPAISDAFNAFALDFDVDLPSLSGGDPIAVRLYSDWSAATWTDDGGRLSLRAASAPYDVVTPYTNLGAVSRLGCGSGTQTLIIPGASPIEVVLADDTINQLLHAAWRGGLLELDIPPEMLSGVDLSTYGITDMVLTGSGMLQPTAADCGRTPDQGLGLHIGDLRIDADFNLFGQPLSMIVYISLRAGLQLSAASDGIGIAVTGIEAVDLEVNVEDEAFISVEPIIEDLLLENLVPSLTGLLGGDALGSFPLPEIDLSASIDGLPPGTIIRIVPSGVIRQGGNSIVQATLVR